MITLEKESTLCQEATLKSHNLYSYSVHLIASAPCDAQVKSDDSSALSTQVIKSVIRRTFISVLSSAVTALWVCRQSVAIAGTWMYDLIISFGGFFFV